MDNYNGMREVFCGAVKCAWWTVEDMILKNDDAESASDYLEMTGSETWELMSQEFKLRSLKEVYNTRETIDLAKAEPHLQAAALWLLIDFQTTICPWSSLDYSWFWGDVVDSESREGEIASYIDECEVLS